MASKSSNSPELYEAQSNFPMDSLTLHFRNKLALGYKPDHYPMETIPKPPHCACTQCECPNLARTPTVYTSNSGYISVEPQPAFCLRCENLELWGKNSPSYKNCKCDCRCQLKRVDGQLQCGDCLEANQKNPHHHQTHGKA